MESPMLVSRRCARSTNYERPYKQPRLSDVESATNVGPGIGAFICFNGRKVGRLSFDVNGYFLLIIIHLLTFRETGKQQQMRRYVYDKAIILLAIFFSSLRLFLSLWLQLMTSHMLFLVPL